MRTEILALAALLPVLFATGCGRDRAEAENHSSQADTGVAARDSGLAAADSATQGVAVSAEERSRLGIVVVTAESRELVREVRLVGRVTPAETASRTVTTKVDGFVERLYVDFTGRAVRQGEPLFELYSPMLVAAQQELLLAVRLRGSLGAAPSSEAAQNADSLVAASRRRLEYWDISADQIAELERSGAVRRTMTLRAPVNGVVLQKNVVQGQAIMAGTPLLQIADLSTVWLEADVFENDLSAVRVGLSADVSLDAYPGEVLRGRVAYLYPTVDPVSRTGRVRIELSNPAGRMRPGLFGTVRIRAPLRARGVVIPRQAALVTGDRQLVFVEDSAGRFVPRLVTLGFETDSLVEVLRGLRAGERVVGAAAFLLDAESNLGAALAAMAGMDMGGGSGGGRRAAPRPARNGH
ncbi:MAG: efflux RND transporter periplasmic adaptor subunit [Gemmatimonadales bacterium]|nr:efflux RND transporter periplasmic adaptor subunit [Gemmatimonadales bacterium]